MLNESRICCFNGGSACVKARICVRVSTALWHTDRLQECGSLPALCRVSLQSGLRRFVRRPEAEYPEKNRGFPETTGYCFCIDRLGRYSFRRYAYGTVQRYFSWGYLCVCKAFADFWFLYKRQRGCQPAVHLYAKEKLDKICHILYNLTRTNIRYLIAYCLNLKIFIRRWFCEIQRCVP